MDLLEVKHLKLELSTFRGSIMAVRDISFHAKEKETVAIVGESGCGKTMTCLSIMNLFPRNSGKIHEDTEIVFNGRKISHIPEKEMQKIRGAEIGMIFQDPAKALNPTEKIGDQIIDILRAHQKMSKKEALKEASILLQKVGISDEQRRLGQYPHELSGGMRQRIVIAMAIACKPKLLIADEPTTALDVTIQAQILELLRSLQKTYGMTILLVTHNLGVVASMADRILVMYGGKIVETGTTEDIFYRPRHPYTRALLDTIPQDGKKGERFQVIPGTPPSLIKPPKGCPFLARCKKGMQICSMEFPQVYADGSQQYYCHLYSPQYLAWKEKMDTGGNPDDRTF